MPNALFLPEAPAVPDSLCLGIDVAWWGGSNANKASQRDTIVYGIVGRQEFSPLGILPIDLSKCPNPKRDDPTEPNYDPQGKLLVDGIETILDTHEGKFNKCVIALDAPLEAQPRPNVSQARRTASKGEKKGTARREAERGLAAFTRRLPASLGSVWNRDLLIQAGSPIVPRVQSILKELREKLGFSLFGRDRSSQWRHVIEVFPSEAIWSLGLLGYYPGASSAQVRQYKKSEPRHITHEEALAQARRPLTGFIGLLTSGEKPNLDATVLRGWADQIAEHACTYSKNDQRGTVAKGKGFDDPLESGIAFFTAVCFALGKHHVWGEETDGTIVGPGTGMNGLCVT